MFVCERPALRLGGSTSRNGVSDNVVEREEHGGFWRVPGQSAPRRSIDR